MKKHEIYVEITNEQERLKAIEILEKAGERIWNGSKLYSKGVKGLMSFNYKCWGIFNLDFSQRTKITLEQLEEMLMPIQYHFVGECKGNNDDGCFLESCGHDCGCFKKVPKSENPLFIAQRYIIDNFPPGTVVTITNGLIEVK